MAITQVGSTTNTGNLTSVTSRAPAVPAGAASGHVAFVFLDLWQSGVDPAVTPPSGFTELYKATSGDGNAKCRCFWKRLTGADTGTYSFSWTGAMWGGASCTLLAGVKTSGDPVGANFNSAVVTGTTFPSTTVNPGHVPGLLWHGYNDQPGTHAPPTSPAGFTETTDADCYTDAYYFPGSGTSFTVTGATTAVSAPLVAALVAVKPEMIFTAETPFQATASVTTSGAMALGTRVSGDCTLLVCALNASSGVITPPAGWSEVLTSTPSTFNTSDAHAIYYKKWVGGDADPTVTCTSGRLAVLPVRVQGADPDAFIEVAASVTQMAGADTAVVAPTVTSTASSVMCCTFNGRSATNGVFITWTPPGGTTEVGEAGGQAAAATNASASFNTSVITPGTPSGTRTGTASSTVTGGMGVSFVIREAGGGVPPEGPANSTAMPLVGKSYY